MIETPWPPSPTTFEHSWLSRLADSLAPPEPASEDPRLAACRQDVGAYGEFAHGHVPARHHRQWLERVTELVEGRGRRRKLLIVAPPGHAKSTWLSLIFPPWYLGNWPDEALLFFTSSDTMARQFGGTVKGTLEANDHHAAVFPWHAARPDRGRGWSTDGLYLRGAPRGGKDPSYRALGYGAAVVGARAPGIILDDPLSQEQARSEVEQRKAKQYRDLTVDSRLHPDGYEIAIMTAWHEADLRAHLAAKAEWELLHLPALGEDGAALWPERFPAGWLAAKRAEIGGPLFNCLYQGDPTSLGGEVFRAAAWFRPLPSDFHERREDGRSLRDRLLVLQGWDLAFSERDSADYTACVTLGLDRRLNLYLLHAYRGRLTVQQTCEQMVELIGLYKPGGVAIEESAYRAGVVQQLAANVARRVVANLRIVKPVGDKVLRARLPAARAEAGMVYADTAAPWWPAFEAECLGFPNAAHDDQVDAFSLATHLAAQAAAEMRAPKELVFRRG